MIDFEDIPWISKAPGIRSKTFRRDGKKIKLVEFTDGYLEEDWCSKPHFGFVLEGSFSIEFEDGLVHFAKGDGIFIQGGEENRHRALISKRERALLILFEQSH